MTFNGQKFPRPEALFHSFVALKEVTQSSKKTLNPKEKSPKHRNSDKQKSGRKQSVNRRRRMWQFAKDECELITTF